MQLIDKCFTFRSGFGGVTMFDPALDEYYTLEVDDSVKVIGNLVHADTPTAIVTLTHKGFTKIDDRRTYFIRAWKLERYFT